MTFAEDKTMLPEELLEQVEVEMHQRLSQLRQEDADLSVQIDALSQTMDRLSETQESDRTAHLQMFDEIIAGLEQALSPVARPADGPNAPDWSAPQGSDRRP